MTNTNHSSDEETSNNEEVESCSEHRIVLVAGTYDGVLAGWELDLSPKNFGKSKSVDANVGRLKHILASPTHSGSVRSLTVAGNGISKNESSNGSLASNVKQLVLSAGYDEVIYTHDFGSQRVTASGEIRTPTDCGTPTCIAFCPPRSSSVFSQQQQHNEKNPCRSTHCLVGFSGRNDSMMNTAGGSVSDSTGGKLLLYRRKDWTVEHQLKGHEGGGISALSVHPTGKLALSGGRTDGKLKLWDLERGRLAYSNSAVVPKSSALASNKSAETTGRRKMCEAIVCIVWSQSGSAYAYCYGNHAVVRDVATGHDLLNTELPSKIHEICLMEGTEGLFLAAACNDGSLPVLAVTLTSDDERKDKNETTTFRGIMAIEPVIGDDSNHVAGEERFKCIQSVAGYHVATANSAGVVSIMDLEGAVRMLMSDDDEEKQSNTPEKPNKDGSDAGSSDEEGSNSEDDILAVDIIDSVQLGTGARITCLTVFTIAESKKSDETVTDDGKVDEIDDDVNSNKKKTRFDGDVAKEQSGVSTMDSDALTRARTLVAEAKVIQTKKKNKKKKKKRKTN